MAAISPAPPALHPLDGTPFTDILGHLYRMTVDQYERLAESGVLGTESVELIGGLLVRKITKKPPHVLACEAARDLLLPLLPPGWRLTLEAPVRIPDFDEPEPNLAIVRGTRKDYKLRHPGPSEIALLIEVADASLAWDRGEKCAAYARGGITTYWIVNLVDNRLEVYSEPTAEGYRNARFVTSEEHVAVVLDQTEVGRIAVADLLLLD
jgi:hypothetical protein